MLFNWIKVISCEPLAVLLSLNAIDLGLELGGLVLGLDLEADGLV